jgi:uncharacterized protein YyaL (SSP411 family)
MLYDQSQLARVYLHAWQVTGNEFFRTITEEILDYVVREMTYVGAGANDPQFRRTPKLPSNAKGVAGFYSTQDADSEGKEGKFFVWTPDEIRAVLGSDADAFVAAYGVTRHGNFEGKNILEFVGDLNQRPALSEARRRLFEAREKRIHPGQDEKVLTSWNGLMLAAFAEAARTLNREDYQDLAERNADFLLRELRQENGRLLRTWKRRPEPVPEGPAEGAGKAKLNGYLEDYSYLIEGLLELYQTTFEPRWSLEAQERAETMIAHFRASEGVQLDRTGQLPSNDGGIAGFFDTSDDHETLITRPRDLQGNATPSGNAMAVTTLLKLAGLTNELRYVDIVHQALAQMQPMLAPYPLGFGQWLQALSFALSQSREIVIVGDPQAVDTQARLSVVSDSYRPFQVAALGAPDTQTPAVPLLQYARLFGGRTAAYVCRAFAREVSATEPEGLQQRSEERCSGPGLTEGNAHYRKASG